MAIEILDLIKKRKTIRKYKNKLIPQKIMNKIIEGGIWSSSLHGFQPWKFIIINNRILIKKLSDILLKKSKGMGAGGNIIMHSSSDTIRNSQTSVIIYNSGEFAKWTAKFNKRYIKFAKVSELSAVSAAIQNMILVAENLGVCSCWLGTPLFCEKEINELININDELVAILTFGYPAEKGRRSARKPLSPIIRYL